MKGSKDDFLDFQDEVNKIRRCFGDALLRIERDSEFVSTNVVLTALFSLWADTFIASNMPIEMSEVYISGLRKDLRRRLCDDET